MDEAHEGGCFCGQARYRMTGRPMFIHACHCRDCQRQTGGPFAINGLIEASEVTLTQGDTVTVTVPTESGRPHDIVRCPACQTALWSDYGRRGYLLFLRIATLDAPDDFVPDVHIYTRSRLPWLPLPEGARAFEAYYDITTEWPAESRARRQAASDSAKR